MASFLLQQQQQLWHASLAHSGVLRQLAGLQQLAALPAWAQQPQQQQQPLLQQHSGLLALQQTCGHGLCTSTQAAATAAAGRDGDIGMTSSSSSSSSSDGGSRPEGRAARQQRAYQARLRAYKARLPRPRKYGPQLRDWSPEAFEQMRLVVGYYSEPQNRDTPKPPQPTHVHINNLQTLLHTNAVDPYYKLALLSYRSKLQNMELVEGLHKARAFLGHLSSTPNFVPADLEGLAAAAPAGRQQQQQQEQPQPQEPDQQQDAASEAKE